MCSERTVRPTFQSTMTTSIATATAMGIQPPSKNLRRLAAKNGRSNDRKSTSGGSAFHSGQPQVLRVTTK